MSNEITTALPPTEPITLPLRDQFGDYSTNWVPEPDHSLA